MNKNINEEIMKRKRLTSSSREINLEYLKMLDSEIEMIPVTFDPVFKRVFGNNLDLLKRFLNEVLVLDLDVDVMELQILNNELPREDMREYQKKIDVYVCINGSFYVDIEINRSNFNRVKMRNYLYSSKLYSMLLDSGKKVSDLDSKYFCQLNLNTMDKDFDYGEEIIVPYSLTTKSVYIEQDKIVLKYLEYYKKLYYTDKKKLDEAGLWLAGLGATTFAELFEIFSEILEADVLTNFIKDVIEMNEEYFNIHEWEKEKLEELVRYNYYKDGVDEGKLEGKLEGKIEGKIEGKLEGIEETQENIIKEMLKDNVDIKLISKYTDKSIEYIKRLEETMK